MEIKIEGINFHVRPWQKTDFNKGHTSLLSQLTQIGKITEDDYNDSYDLLNSIQDTYYILVIENIDQKVLVGSATLFTEHKLIHGCGKVGHIEDVVVDIEYRGFGLGKLLIENLVEKAKENGCYKVILDCNQDNIQFYEKCGFRKVEFEMRRDI